MGIAWGAPSPLPAHAKRAPLIPLLEHVEEHPAGLVVQVALRHLGRGVLAAGSIGGGGWGRGPVSAGMVGLAGARLKLAWARCGTP